MASPEYTKQESCLNFVARYIGERQNVAQVIGELKSQPDVFDRITWQLDEAIGSLNAYLSPDYPDHLIDGDFISNVARTRGENATSGTRLPYLQEIMEDSGFINLKTGIKTLRRANTLMTRGEADESGGWAFHRQSMSVEDFTSAMLLEIYSLYLRQKFPKFDEKGINPILPLEEVIASIFPNSDLFIAAKPWYTQEEGFSARMTNYVSRIDVSKLHRKRPYIENPEFTVMKIEDPSQIQGNPSHPVSIGVGDVEYVLPGDIGLAYRNILVELNLNLILSDLKSNSKGVFLVRWEGGKVPRSVEIDGRIIGWTQNGIVSDVEGNQIGTYDKFIESGGKFGDLQLMAIYPQRA